MDKKRKHSRLWSANRKCACFIWACASTRIKWIENENRKSFLHFFSSLKFQLDELWRFRRINFFFLSLPIGVVCGLLAAGNVEKEISSNVARVTERRRYDYWLVECDPNNNLVNDPLSPLLIKLIESCANGKSIDSLNHFVRMHSTQIFHSIKCVKLSMESVCRFQRGISSSPDTHWLAATLTHTTIYESISTMQSSITEHIAAQQWWGWSRDVNEKLFIHG